MASFKYKNVYIDSWYSIAGKYENNGKLIGVNRYLEDFYDGEKTFENAEVKMQKETVNK